MLKRTNEGESNSTEDSAANQRAPSLIPVRKHEVLPGIVAQIASRAEARSAPVVLLDQCVDTPVAAQVLGCSIGFLEKRRLQGKPPRVVRIGRLVRYSLAELRLFIEQNTVA